MANIIAQGVENVERLEATFTNVAISEVATDYLKENGSNPRRFISEDSIAGMMNGIRQTGGEILQPLLARPITMNESGHRYEVICGNRRLLAARRLGMPTVPVRIRDIDDETAARFALWENLSREDLNAMDTAESINHLRGIDKISWEEIGERFGFTRQWGWKQQKLAELPEVVRDMVRSGTLAPSKAMLLSALDDETCIETAERIVAEGLSHRAAEQILRGAVLTEEECKHVFTFTPPQGYSPRRFASIFRAAQTLANSLSNDAIPPTLASAMREIAERLLLLSTQSDLLAQSDLSAKNDQNATESDTQNTKENA
jgi:ParB/RepB/Spo0J family partition protein